MDFVRCDFGPATYLIYSPEVEPLIYYSHFVAIFAALSISLLVFFHNPRRLVSKLFLLFAIVFSFWTFLDVILWASNDPGIIMFSWSLQVLAEPVLYAIAFYLFYRFVNGHIPPLSINALVFVLLLPLVVLLPTSLNLEAVYLSFCETEEGPLALYYTYFLNTIFVGLIVVSAALTMPKLDTAKRVSAYHFIIGLIIFLFSFTFANLISSFTDDWTISQYGLFAMPVFAGFIAYSIVQFRMFQIQVAGAQVLVVVLFALVTSLLFVQAQYRLPITITTIFFTLVSGWLLIKSVKIEFEQKLELEQLTKKLEKANKRLKILDQMKSEFVSVASHQLRSPLTSIRGYASMMLEGSYGKLSDKAKDAVERIAESSRMMALSVEDYLNVSRIQAGNMKYDYTDFNLADTASQIVDDVRRDAVKRGLVLSYKSDMKKKGIVHADKGKAMQILHNLINNAVKYTPKGTITIFAHDKGKKIMIDVIDTGIGMSEETIESVFGKFERAHNANEVNVTGTGLGLYVAQKMAQEMKGDIEAFSDGEGKGSTFRLTLPLQM